MNLIKVIVETPKGSAQKYVYEPEYKVFKLKKLLPAGMIFPFDFGFIPGTKGEDGDPLDVVVLWEFGSFPGCGIECRLIGCIQAKQKGENGAMIRNDRFIAIPEASIMYSNINSIKELPVNILFELEMFFSTYANMQKKDFHVLGTVDEKEALSLVHSATV
jgi:inorganic pyrophosphatase